MGLEMVFRKESMHIFNNNKNTFSPLNLVHEEINAFAAILENVVGRNRSKGDTSVLPAALNGF
jgi:hypothetical protein